MIDLTDQVAIVTGAGRGIGRAIALRLSELGASVVVNNRDPERNRAMVEAITEAGGRAVGQPGDVAEPDVAEALVKAATDSYGRLDIVVNNAGIVRDTLIARMTDEQWSEVLNVNLTGAFQLIRAATRPMMRQRSGRIINISSVVGRIGNAGQANYAASKAGLIGLTMSVARELAPRGVTCNAVAPGFIDEGMTEGLNDEIRQVLLKTIPLARLGAADDVANAVAFLASDRASYITGQVLSVDGGMVMG